MCNGHYNRWYTGKPIDGPLRRYNKSADDQYAYVVANLVAAGECLEFDGPSTDRGYGRVGDDDYAHRIVAEHHFGPAPADKPYVLHSCDNPPCCNPMHLRWGTQAENIQDAQSRGRIPVSNRRR
jgi:hypothetical protein